MTFFKRSLIAVTVTLTLAACGGSDDTAETPKPIDPPVLQPLPAEEVTVDIQNSQIKAMKESLVVTSLDDEQTLASIEAFKGIRYAQAERFQHSEVEELAAEVDATSFQDACPQLKTTTQAQSEDCLNLNIWRPADTANDAQLPVYVFIHGGDFEYGAGSEPLIHADTVVAQGAAEDSPFIAVTLNYRLGLLGSHWKKDNQGGNYGLGDQKRALEWVQNYIADFGGDAQNITLMGQGAGAMSVGILQQEDGKEPVANTYFNRAIMQSNPYGFDYRTYDQAEDFADKVADIQAEMPELDDANLADLPLDQLMQVQAKALSPLARIGDWTGLSCIDTSNLAGSALCLTSKVSGEATPLANLMPFAPYIEYKKTLFGKIDGYHLASQPALDTFAVPTVVGVNSDEANTAAMLPSLTFLISGLLPSPEEEDLSSPEAIVEWLSKAENQQQIETKLAAMTADDIKAQLELGDLTAYLAMTKFYFGLGNGDLTNGLLGLTDYYPNPEGEIGGGLENMKQFKMLLNDMIFAGPSRLQAKQAQENAIDSTFYHFGYHASFNVWTYNTDGQEGKLDIGDLIKTISCITGACNGSELPFVFNKALKLDGSTVKTSSKDEALMNKMSRLWFSDELFEAYQYDASSDTVLTISKDGDISTTTDWDSNTQSGLDPELRKGRLNGLENLGFMQNYMK
ncbi:carboxylesterase family protein [Shewanella gaetbuli]|uniref:Carboxylesterase family protein n=1 Tax=Shewanella gaetbuli TaxID=220752 RepID=A0A9X1ZK08_9GAMM|nr:carboxylesterase family protein [Shewanella gaetbuli]MCL1142392.1 carboxylesterase family protein [Shewanella gaetbuli]